MMIDIIEAYGLKDITESRLIEMFNNEASYYRLLHELRASEQLNETMKSEYMTGSKRIRELQVKNQDLDKKLKKQKRKAKRKCRQMKIEYLSEIVYLKSKLYDNSNIYEVKKKKPQNIVKIR